MPSCEKCWARASAEAKERGGHQADIYCKLVETEHCTPEEQAGPDATRCPDCHRKTVHQHAKVCVICGRIEEPRGGDA